MIIIIAIILVVIATIVFLLTREKRGKRDDDGLREQRLKSDDDGLRSGAEYFEDGVIYPVTKFSGKTMIHSKPLKGKGKILTNNCSYMSALQMSSSSEKQLIIEKHIITPSTIKCDNECDNIFIQQLYESYLILLSLKDFHITSDILEIYRKVIDAFKTKVLNGESARSVGNNWEKLVQKWEAHKILYPVNQKERDWTSYKKPHILRDLAGIEHDPTAVLISGDFIKFLQFSLPAEFLSSRNDEFYRRIVHRVRGFRTNNKNRFKESTSLQKLLQFPGEYKKESQVGITNFNFPDLKLPPRYYDTKPWMHPGRSKCDTHVLQGMYQHSVKDMDIPLVCNLSGSTNYWIWTALFSGVNMTVDEVRLYVFSAFLTMGADGGHSLMEVLSSATLSAIYLKHYDTYSKDKYLSKFIKASNFVENLYEATKDINPIGNKDVIKINYAYIANQIYNNPEAFPVFEVNEDLKTIEYNIRKRLIAKRRHQAHELTKLPFGTLIEQALRQSQDVSWTRRVNALNCLYLAKKSRARAQGSGPSASIWSPSMSPSASPTASPSASPTAAPMNSPRGLRINKKNRFPTSMRIGKKLLQFPPHPSSGGYKKESQVGITNSTSPTSMRIGKKLLQFPPHPSSGGYKKESQVGITNSTSPTVSPSASPTTASPTTAPTTYLSTFHLTEAALKQQLQLIPLLLKEQEEMDTQRELDKLYGKTSALKKYLRDPFLSRKKQRAFHDRGTDVALGTAVDLEDAIARGLPTNVPIYISTHRRQLGQAPPDGFVDEAEPGEEEYKKKLIVMILNHEFPGEDKSESLRRQQIEAFFLYGRRQYKFGDYTVFLNKIPMLSSIRKQVIKKLTNYVNVYCLDKPDEKQTEIFENRSDISDDPNKWGVERFG
jgi:hypothetical protein